MSQTARDRDFSTPQEVYASGEGPMYSFPFEAIGDFSTFIVTRQFKQTRAAYLIDKLSNRYRVGEAIDPAGSSAVLLNTREIGITATGLQSFSRSYAPVPPTQTDSRHSTMVNLPSIPASYTFTQLSSDDVLTSDSRNFRFAEAYMIDGRAIVYFDVYKMQTPSATAQVVAAGGTFVFSYKASSTAGLASGASNATIAAAINALADIIADTITVTADNQLGTAANGNLDITATVGTFLATPSVNAAGLTPALATIGDGRLTSSTVFRYQTRYALTLVAHGIVNTGQSLANCNLSTNLNTFYLGSTGCWSVGDVDTILIVINRSGGTPFNLNAGAVFAGFQRRYVPGSVPCPCDLITRFSLSPLTPDTYQGDTYNFLVALFAGSTSINYRVGDSIPWPDEKSPINSMTTTVISAANL